MLGLDCLTHLLTNLLELLIKHVVGAIDEDLRQAGYGSALNILALLFLNHVKRKLLEVTLEQLDLLLWILHLTQHMPLYLPYSFANHGVQLALALFLQFFLETS